MHVSGRWRTLTCSNGHWRASFSVRWHASYPFTYSSGSYNYNSIKICKQISTPPQPYQKIPDIYFLRSCSLPNFISIPSPITIQFVVDVFVLYVILYLLLYCLLCYLVLRKLNKLYYYAVWMGLESVDVVTAAGVCSKLEADVKRLKSELQSSRCLEQELRSQIASLSFSDRTAKSELYQLRQENESLQSKYVQRLLHSATSSNNANWNASSTLQTVFYLLHAVICKIQCPQSYNDWDSWVVCLIVWMFEYGSEIDPAQYRTFVMKTWDLSLNTWLRIRLATNAFILVHGQVTIIFVVFVCLFVCLCRVFLSRLWSDFDQTRTYVICVGLVVSPGM